MNYTVVWHQDAEEALVELWQASEDQQGIRSAADRLDQLLRVDPVNIGESRTSGLRLAFEHPIQILFRVDEDLRRVMVVQADLAKRSR